MTSESRVDIGILTIKDEEFEAVLNVFNRDVDIYRSPTTHRQYNLRTAQGGPDTTYRVAVVRHIEQGTGEAQGAAYDLLQDLSPQLILVVGIAGGAPSNDFTLGDVILSMRIHDYTVEARHVGRGTEYAIGGGPVDRLIEGHIANLKARAQELGDWTKELPERPPVVLSDANFKGHQKWKEKVRASLEHHFTKEPKRPPRFLSGPIGSSDRLIKDPRVLISWLKTSRNLLAVEMESAGVYRAARGRCSMISIRGISDIVGFERDERWTRYACQSAAAFAEAFLRTTPIPKTPPNPR